jgi:hypothetical protein
MVFLSPPRPFSSKSLPINRSCSYLPAILLYKVRDAESVARKDKKS